MGVSLTQAQTYLTSLQEAYAAVITGKSFTLTFGGNTRSVFRQDGDWILKQINYWTSYIAKLQSGNKGLGVKFGVSYDNY